MTERRHGWSLRRRVLLIAGLASIATLLLGGIAMYVAAEAEEDKLLDARLGDLGRTILSFSEHEIAEILAEGRTEMIHIETAATLGKAFHYQVWSTGGKLLLRSHMASTERPMAPLDMEGLRSVTFDGEPYRVFAFRGQSGMILQAAERLQGRDSAIGMVSFYFLALLLVPFAAIALVTWWQLNRALHAIDESARQLRRRSPIDLSPLHAQDPPQELRPMIESINSLFGRIREAMSLERGFTAVAAHELRSPLAGLRAQAQLASMSRSDCERNEALAAVMQGVDRCARLLEQLLDLAHSEALAPGGTALTADVAIERVLQHALADLHTEIERRRVRLTARLNAPRVHAVEWALVLLLRNLLCNAIRHTPEGSTVEVISSRQDAAVVLTVDDSGSGIPPALRQRVFERFERLGRNDCHGVGLGLSIVRSIVQSHGATIHLLDSPLGGLRVQVLFALPPEAERGLREADRPAGVSAPIQI